ncbi:MAG: hypothetical protein ACRDHL_05710 [Candidatus Promineifilaceae bacterium]
MLFGRRLGPACRGAGLAIALLLLAACAGAGELPTRAHRLITPAPTNTTLPPTFTPFAQGTLGHLRLLSRPLGPTPTPSVTPVLPTRTPWPTASATFSASPTPTRYVSVLPELPPTDELGPSKLGIHVVRNNDPAIMDFVRRTQPAVVKAVDDFGFLAEVQAASPRTITIGRHTIASQSYAGSAEEAARLFVEQYLPLYRANPAVDYWEGWNEPDPDYEHMIWYSRFEQERVRQMAQHGLRCAIGSFAAGVPEMDEFQLFLPAIDAAMQHDGILSLHEYAAPDMAYLYGGALPGFPSHPDRGSLTFRYRWFYGEYLEPGDMVIPLVISEAGVDGLIGNRPGPDGRGWLDFQHYWVSQGLGGTGVEAFLNQLAWYDAGVRQDGYVMGFTVFTAGAIEEWRAYDITPILPQVADYVINQG